MNADSVRSKARKRAIRGAEMLDEKMPGWHKFPGPIDIHTLNMDSTYNCVIGQLFPEDGYIWGVEKLMDAASLGSNEFSKFAKRHGFDAPVKVYGSAFRDLYFHVLQRAWTDEILNRRAADFVAPRLSED